MIVVATIIDSRKSLHRPTCILTIFYQFYFVYLYEIYHLLLYNLTTFSTPQKSRKTAFLQPNPVCDFDPWFYDFWETVMITGSGLKKSYIFRFCVFFRFFDAMILMFLIRFLFDFFWLRGFSPVFRLQLFRPFHFSVNNFILCANSTEISGFSVLLCFWATITSHIIFIVDSYWWKGGFSCFK